MLCAENTVELQEPHPWIIDRLRCILGPEGEWVKWANGFTKSKGFGLNQTTHTYIIDIENAMGFEIEVCWIQDLIKPLAGFVEVWQPPRQLLN